MLQCVAVWCVTAVALESSARHRCVAVACCSVLQCVAACGACPRYSRNCRGATHYKTLQHMLQHPLQPTCWWRHGACVRHQRDCRSHAAGCHTATHRNTYIYHTATHAATQQKTLQHIHIPHCNTHTHHTATHAATHRNTYTYNTATHLPAAAWRLPKTLL